MFGKQLLGLSSSVGKRQVVLSFSSSSSSTASLLPFSTLKRIKAELKEADVNGDGRIDFEELKQLLNKYPFSFTPSQIEQIGELFYVGKSGQSVPHLTFLRGIQHIIMQESNSSSSSDGDSHATANNSETISNPLQLTSLDDNRCWVSPAEAEDTSGQQLYDIQAQFEKSLLTYVREVRLLETLGGPKVLEQVSEQFYQRVVQDPRLEIFFVGQDMKRLKGHPYNFMRIAFAAGSSSKSSDDDPELPNARKIQHAHRRLIREKGLNETHFDMMLEHFVATLKEDTTVAQDVIDTATEVIYLYRDSFIVSDDLDNDDAKPSTKKDNP